MPLGCLQGGSGVPHRFLLTRPDPYRGHVSESIGAGCNGGGGHEGAGCNRRGATVARATSALVCRPPQFTRAGSSRSVFWALPAAPVVAAATSTQHGIPHGAAPPTVLLQGSRSFVPAQPAGAERCSPTSHARGIGLTWLHLRSPQRAMGAARQRRYVPVLLHALNVCGPRTYSVKKGIQTPMARGRST